MSCKSKSNKSKEKVVDAYLAAKLANPAEIEVPVTTDPIVYAFDLNEINLQQNIDTQTFVNPNTTPFSPTNNYTGFVCLIDGTYRVSYSIQCNCSGLRITADLVKNGSVFSPFVITLPESVSKQFFQPNADQKDNVDKSIVLDLKRGDVLSLRAVIQSNLGFFSNELLFGSNTNIAFNKI